MWTEPPSSQTAELSSVSERGCDFGLVFSSPLLSFKKWEGFLLFCIKMKNLHEIPLETARYYSNGKPTGTRKTWLLQVWPYELLCTDQLHGLCLH